MWGVFVLVHAGFHALLEDILSLDGEYPPVDGYALVMQRLVKYANYVVAHNSSVYVEGPPVAAVVYGNWCGLQFLGWFSAGFSGVVPFGCVVRFRAVRFVSDR